MRFQGRMELEQGIKLIEIIPLINLVFLLLIFLMLGSSFIMQPGINISLPRVITSDVISPGNIEIIVTGEGLIYLNGKISNIEEARILFKQAGKRNQPVLIKADRAASLGKIVEIWDLARGLGISRINIATNQ